MKLLQSTVKSNYFFYSIHQISVPLHSKIMFLGPFENLGVGWAHIWTGTLKTFLVEYRETEEYL
jgi:hypothetical protein